MKLTTEQLKQIIKEELGYIVNESSYMDNDIVPFNDKVKKVMDELIPPRLPKYLSEPFVQILVNNVGRYSQMRSDRQFFGDNLKIKIDDFVGHVIFDYFDTTTPGGLDIMSDYFPDFSGEDFELAHDYIEFHPETQRVVSQLKEMIEFTIKMSEIKRNSSDVPEDSMEGKMFKLFDSGPAGFVQAFELIGSLI